MTGTTRSPLPFDGDDTTDPGRRPARPVDHRPSWRIKAVRSPVGGQILIEQLQVSLRQGKKPFPKLPPGEHNHSKSNQRRRRAGQPRRREEREWMRTLQRVRAGFSRAKAFDD